MTWPALDLQFSSMILLPLVILGQQCPNEEPVFYEDSYATIDYALLGDTKELSLCRVTDRFTGCDISWTKDGATLGPSPQKVSFADRGQYLFISDVGASDVGNYSCSVSSGGGQISRNLTLRVYEDCSHPPFSNSWSECKLDDTAIGGNVSATCKFDIGCDADEVPCTWWKRNDSAVPGSDEEWLPTYAFPEIQSDYRSCGDPEIDMLLCGTAPPDSMHIFACLHLFNVTEDYYGKYAITVANGYILNVTLELNELTREPPTGVVDPLTVCIVVFSILVAFVILILLWQSVKTEIKLQIKDNFGGKAENDGKLYDAYISYIWDDTDTMFALSLKQHLELRGYKVFVPEVDTTGGGCTVEEIARALEKSRRFIMILSERYISSSFSAYEVTSFVDRVSRYKNNIISIIFKGSEVDTESCRTILKHVLILSRVVKWSNIMPSRSDDPVTHRQDSLAEVVPTEPAVHTVEESFKGKVFKELLLGMPPKPRASHTEGAGENITMQGHINNGFSNI